jgi:hypothetical protein
MMCQRRVMLAHALDSSGTTCRQRHAKSRIFCRVDRISKTKMRFIARDITNASNAFAYANRYETDGRGENQELVGLKCEQPQGEP